MTEIPREVRAFAADIQRLLADDTATLSIREEPPEEPGITLLVRRVALFWFTRSEFLEALYVAGCDALEDLERRGLPLAVRTGPVQ